MSEENQELICVRIYEERTLAELSKAYLKSCGIDAIVSADDFGGMIPAMTASIGPARLMVRPEDALAAEELLEQSEQESDMEFEDEAEEEVAKEEDSDIL